MPRRTLVQASPLDHIDLNGQDSAVSELLDQRLEYIDVVFSESADRKPHAEFSLEVTADAGIGVIRSWTNQINLGMNPHLLPRQNTTESITLNTSCGYGKELLSFRFRVKDNHLTVRQYLRVLRGDSEETDLAKFANGRPFEIGSQPRDATMGSRDFVTQCMIRWEQHGMISWDAEDTLLPHGVGPPEFWCPYDFFSFITKPHRVENGDYHHEGPEIPMKMGIWHARVNQCLGADILYAPVDTSVDLEGNHPLIQQDNIPTPQTYPLHVDRLLPGTGFLVLPLVPPVPVPYRPHQVFEGQQPSPEQQPSQEQQVFQGYQPWRAQQALREQEALRELQAFQEQQAAQVGMSLQWQPPYQGSESEEEQDESP
ncbi:unnamed protein product [Clonostachys solani]|uniref:Uncharacterized protein n=1 Tax=Clonostachys solani TaxID=160281 RepID=A0A9N9W9J3_9HYPO|nr:unnamed protein product [Clonostachys solani]